MEKIFKALLTICVALCYIAFVNPAHACSQNTIDQSKSTQITGGACSIKELNNLENNRAVKGKINLPYGLERNLRPVKPNSEMFKSNDCLFGTCLYRTILENKAIGK